MRLRRKTGPAVPLFLQVERDLLQGYAILDLSPPREAWEGNGAECNLCPPYIFEVRRSACNATVINHHDGGL